MSFHVAVEKPVSVTFLELSVRRHQSVVTRIEQKCNHESVLGYLFNSSGC